MRTATITEAKNGLSALLDHVRAGESIIIVDRGNPVARLEPVVAHPDQSGRLQRLERAGLLRIGAGPYPLDLLRQPAPRLPDSVSALEILIDERRSGR
jgi:prevent-host-death family protein